MKSGVAGKARGLGCWRMGKVGRKGGGVEGGGGQMTGG